MPDDQTAGEAGAQEIALTIKGIKFKTFPVFFDGHVLNAAEASVLNQTRVENLRNNFASHVEAAKAEVAEANKWFEEDGKTPDTSKVSNEDLDLDDLAVKFETYAKNYVFGVRTVGAGTRASADPVEREAMAIALLRITDAIKLKGFKLADIPIEDRKKLAAKLIEQDPAINEAAKRRVEDSKGIAVDLGALGL